MNLASAIVLLLVAAAFAAVVGRGICNRRRGKGGCSCGDCASCGACHKK